MLLPPAARSARSPATSSTARSRPAPSVVFPWSTFTINLSGCFVVGAVVAALVDRHHTPEWLRLGLVMGVLGGYTTFSTFGQETLDLIEEGRLAVAVTYAVASVAVGVAAVFAGSRLGRMV